MITWLILFAKDCDVMVCTIHSRSHEVDCTCVHSDVLLVCVLLMDSCCNQVSVRCQHETSELCEDSNITHSCWYENLLVYLSYTLADDHDVIWLLVRCVWDSYSA